MLRGENEPQFSVNPFNIFTNVLQELQLLKAGEVLNKVGLVFYSNTLEVIILIMKRYLLMSVYINSIFSFLGIYFM